MTVSVRLQLSTIPRDDREPQLRTQETGNPRGKHSKVGLNAKHILNLETLCHLWNRESKSLGADLKSLLCKGNLEIRKHAQQMAHLRKNNPTS